MREVRNLKIPPSSLSLKTKLRICGSFIKGSDQGCYIVMEWKGNVFDIVKRHHCSLLMTQPFQCPTPTQSQITKQVRKKNYISKTKNIFKL